MNITKDEIIDAACRFVEEDLYEDGETKLSSFIAGVYWYKQKLKQCDCYKLRELLVQKVKDVEETIKDIDKEDGGLIDTWHNYQQGLKYALSLIDTVSP